MAAFIFYLPPKKARTVIIDSSALPVCQLLRAGRHKSAEDLAAYGWATVIGIFYGFKLYLVVDARMNILNFLITPADVYDGHAASQLLPPEAICFI